MTTDDTWTAWCRRCELQGVHRTQQAMHIAACILRLGTDCFRVGTPGPKCSIAALSLTLGSMKSLIGAPGPTSPQPGQPVWQAVLTAAAALRLDALLDCGALLAGASNR